MPDKGTPEVSIITAAYNRSNVLRYAIESVIAQGFTDWELIIVGDACTDDSGDVAMSFGDPRISFVNLEKNTGDQSGPNNEGFRLSKGRYIAYLSQDDIWFPDHLERCIEGIRKTEADWVFSAGFVVFPDDRVMLHGVMPEGVYDPKYGTQAVASLWLLKREVLEATGGWRHYKNILIAPSQDLLIRVWKTGKRILAVPEASAVIMPSAWRKDSYSKRMFEENRRVIESVSRDPLYREKLYSQACLAREAEIARGYFEIGPSFKRLAGALVRRAGLLFGILPIQLIHLVLFRKKGGFIDRIRKVRGLPVYKKS